MQHLNKCSMFKSPYLNCSSILLSPLSMQRLTNWRTLSRLPKQALNTHTKKTMRIYRPQNRNSRALRKIWMKSKMLWVFRKIQKNGVPREPKRTELQQSVWNTRIGGRDVRSGWIESQRSRICLILKFNRASTPSFIAFNYIKSRRVEFNTKLIQSLE